MSENYDFFLLSKYIYGMVSKCEVNKEFVFFCQLKNLLKLRYYPIILHI